MLWSVLLVECCWSSGRARGRSWWKWTSRGPCGGCGGQARSVARLAVVDLVRDPHAPFSQEWVPICPWYHDSPSTYIPIPATMVHELYFQRLTGGKNMVRLWYGFMR
jgi:hypothetical protein